MPRENYGTERVNAQTMLIVFKKRDLAFLRHELLNWLAFKGFWVADPVMRERQIQAASRINTYFNHAISNLEGVGGYSHAGQLACRFAIL